MFRDTGPDTPKKIKPEPIHPTQPPPIVPMFRDTGPDTPKKIKPEPIHPTQPSPPYSIYA
jgi:hypothetical protein